MLLSIDESNLIVTPAISVDLGGYSSALGSAQRLSNGNYHFGSGLVGGSHTNVIETTPGGSITSFLNAAAVDYRVVRMRDLYSAP
jgi:hypothetical protein